MLGQSVPTSFLLTAAIVDRLSLLVWFNTKDGQNGRNRPQMIVDALSQKQETATEKTRCFNSVAEFEEALQKIKGA